MPVQGIPLIGYFSAHFVLHFILRGAQLLYLSTQNKLKEYPGGVIFWQSAENSTRLKKLGISGGVLSPRLILHPTQNKFKQETGGAIFWRSAENSTRLKKFGISSGVFSPRLIFAPHLKQA